VTKHTGVVWFWYQRSYTVTGTFGQCEAALRDAQTHNLLAGWWGVISLLVMNWVALAENHSARKALHRLAGYPHTAPAPVADRRPDATRTPGPRV